jgi:hypothetical protein
MGSSKRFYTQATIILNVSGNRVDEAGGLDRLFWIEMALVLRGSYGPNFF